MVDLVKTSMKWAGTHDMIIVFVDIMKPPMDWASCMDRSAITHEADEALRKPDIPSHGLG